jgi:hypothetical protein
LTRITVENHAEERRVRGDLQTAPRGFVDGLPADRLRRGETNVCCQHLARLHRHRNTDATHQKPDTRQSGYRDRQRE